MMPKNDLTAEQVRAILEWNASITVRGKHVHLGLFADTDVASAAYMKAKREMHEGCAV